MYYVSKDCIGSKNFCLSPTECPLCELKYKFSAAKSSLNMMLQEQRVGGYEFYTTTVGEADGRARSRIFGLVRAVFTFCRLLFIVWGLGLGLS